MEQELGKTEIQYKADFLFCQKVSNFGNEFHKKELYSEVNMKIISNPQFAAVNRKEKREISLVTSQLLLLQSRRKWGIMYMLAAVSGMFVPIGIFTPTINQGDLVLTIVIKNIPLLAASFLIITGMYVLNDLVDTDLDRSSGKKRPISSGQVKKTRALFFVIITNVTGMFLTLMTYNPYSITIALIIIGIGFMYSVPKISLKDRFVVKTGSIAAASMLCLLLGSSYTFGNTGMVINGFKYHISFDVPILVSSYGAVMSGCIIFITSLLNDLGDVDGDKAFGRRTIPLVMGRKNTIMLTIIIATAMILISTTSACLLSQKIGFITPILVSLVAGFIGIKMAKVIKHLNDCEFIRNQYKKSIQWHLMLQSALIVGSLLFGLAL
jgi:4-hydroxybenzoate polyprenyltransferase